MISIDGVEPHSDPIWRREIVSYLVAYIINARNEVR